MAIRMIYSCDWCFVDAKKSDCVDEGWAQVQIKLDLDAHVWLCAVCFAAYKLAVITARDSRSNKV